MNTDLRTSSESGWFHLHRVVVGLLAGAVCGSIGGAVLLGGLAWLNEAQSGIDEQWQWASVAALVGGKVRGCHRGAHWGVYSAT
jgi:hypothetical protein